jgi:hypothetical protein
MSPIIELHLKNLTGQAINQSLGISVRSKKCILWNQLLQNKTTGAGAASAAAWSFSALQSAQRAVFTIIPSAVTTSCGKQRGPDRTAGSGARTVLC